MNEPKKMFLNDLDINAQLVKSSHHHKQLVENNGFKVSTYDSAMKKLKEIRALKEIKK